MQSKLLFVFVDDASKQTKLVIHAFDIMDTPSRHRLRYNWVWCIALSLWLTTHPGAFSWWYAPPLRGDVPRSMLLTTCLELVSSWSSLLPSTENWDSLFYITLHYITLRYVTLRYKAAHIALQAYQSITTSTSIQGCFKRSETSWETSSFRQELVTVLVCAALPVETLPPPMGPRTRGLAT